MEDLEVQNHTKVSRAFAWILLLNTLQEEHPFLTVFCRTNQFWFEFTMVVNGK